MSVLFPTLDRSRRKMLCEALMHEAKWVESGLAEATPEHIDETIAFIRNWGLDVADAGAGGSSTWQSVRAPSPASPWSAQPTPTSGSYEVPRDNGALPPDSSNRKRLQVEFERGLLNPVLVPKKAAKILGAFEDWDPARERVRDPNFRHRYPDYDSDVELSTSSVVPKDSISNPVSPVKTSKDSDSYVSMLPDTYYHPDSDGVSYRARGSAPGYDSSDFGAGAAQRSDLGNSESAAIRTTQSNNPRSHDDVALHRGDGSNTMPIAANYRGKTEGTDFGGHKDGTDDFTTAANHRGMTEGTDVAPLRITRC